MDTSAFALRTLCVTLIVAFVGDLLLRNAGWGFNFAFFGLIVFAAGWFLTRKSPRPLTKSGIFFGLSALFFCLLIAWRDSGELKLANVIAILLSVGAMMHFAPKGGAKTGSMLEYIMLIWVRWIALMGEFPYLLVKDIDWKGRQQTKAGQQNVAMLRGILITAPILIIFGALFASADAVFSKIIQDAFSMDLENFFARIFVIGFLTWTIGGIFRRLFFSTLSFSPENSTPQQFFKLGKIEIGMALGALVAMFALFVGIQFRYLFGGEQHIKLIPDLTYAEYARSGFFELVIVSLLTLLVLIGFNALSDRSDDSATKICRSLSGALVLLVFIVMASALNRMAIYVQAYGLTVLRIYTTAYMFWLALTFLWLVATVLKGRPERLAFGSLVAGFAVIFGLNLLNPDALMARTNLSLKNPDAAQVASLSADALPEIEAKLPHLAIEKQQILIRSIQEKRKQVLDQDWRDLNISSCVLMDKTWLELDVTDEGIE